MKKNYNIPTLTDASDEHSFAKSREGLRRVLQDDSNKLSATQVHALRYMTARDYGKATPAQALLILGAGVPDTTIPLESKMPTPGMFDARLDGNCEDAFTTKELNIAIRLANGKIPCNRLAWVLRQDQPALQAAVKDILLANGMRDHGGQVRLPRGGISGLAGFFKTNELFPYIPKDKPQTPEPEDLTKDLF